jgi:hypothetical protein
VNKPIAVICKTASESEEVYHALKEWSKGQR